MDRTKIFNSILILKSNSHLLWPSRARQLIHEEDRERETIDNFIFLKTKSLCRDEGVSSEDFIRARHNLTRVLLHWDGKTFSSVQFVTIWSIESEKYQWVGDWNHCCVYGGSISLGMIDIIRSFGCFAVAQPRVGNFRYTPDLLEYNSLRNLMKGGTWGVHGGTSMYPPSGIL